MKVTRAKISYDFTWNTLAEILFMKSVYFDVVNIVKASKQFKKKIKIQSH